jgi:hypothetical protein
MSIVTISKLAVKIWQLGFKVDDESHHFDELLWHAWGKLATSKLQGLFEISEAAKNSRHKYNA